MKILQINEIRKAYFLKAFGREPEDMLIISMGACNYNCPYCKRDGQFKGNGNSILNAYDVAMDEIFGVIDKHVAAGHRTVSYTHLDVYKRQMSGLSHYHPAF